MRRYSSGRAFEQLVAPQWEAFCGEGFERLCREALPSIYSKEHISGRFDVGEYWDRSVQIDVVGLRDDGWVDLGECRWIGRTGLSSIARELAVRVGHFPGGNRTVRQLLFVRNTGWSARSRFAVPLSVARRDGSERTEIHTEKCGNLILGRATGGRGPVHNAGGCWRTFQGFPGNVKIDGNRRRATVSGRPTGEVRRHENVAF
jgi:hypothetical protein